MAALNTYIQSESLHNSYIIVSSLYAASEVTMNVHHLWDV